MDLITEVEELKKTVERHSIRLTAIEKSLSEDHKTLDTVKKDVDEMKIKITSVEKECKAIKAQGALTNDSITKLTKLVKIALVVALVAFIYSIVRNETVASGIAALTATIAKFLV